MHTALGLADQHKIFDSISEFLNFRGIQSLAFCRVEDVLTARPRRIVNGTPYSVLL